MTNLIKQIILILSSSIVFIWSLFQTNKVQLPVLIDATITPLVIIVGDKKKNVSLSSLSYRNIFWINYLAGLKFPAGIIHNATDKVVWTNSQSCLKVGDKTTNTHIDKDKLYNLRDLVYNLNDISVNNRNESYIEITYILCIKKENYQVTDRFYKLIIDGDIFRVFEQISKFNI